MKAVKGITVLIITLSLGLIVYGTAMAGNGRGMGQGAGVCLDPSNDGTGPNSGGSNPEGYQGRFGENGRFNGQGLQNGTGPFMNILDGEAVTVAGVIADAGYFGNGIELDMGDEGMVRVYGLGPIRYWNEIEVDRPAVGEGITVTGYEVTFSDGSSKIIATAVAIEENLTVELRDSETGAPLWRGPAFAGRGFMHHNCPYVDDYDEYEEENELPEID